MNLIFIIYLILIIVPAYFKKYKISFLLIIMYVLHIYWFYSKQLSAVYFLTGIISSIAIYLSCIYLLYINHTLIENKLVNIKMVLQKNEHKLHQLSQQQSALCRINKELEHNLGETATIYEYVKKLGSTLDFNEAVLVLQHTLNSLTSSQKGRLILVENGKTSKVYDICQNTQISAADLTDYETNIVNNVFKTLKPLIFEKDRNSTTAVLPASINTLLAIPLIAENQLVSILILENLPLKHMDKIHFIAMQFALEVQKTLLYQKVKELSIIDSLTKLYLRRHFIALLHNELDRCHRQKQPLSFLMMDIDFFKRYNDEYGHLVGDLILKTIGFILKHKSREVDLLCRYGGDEFALVLPYTGPQEAYLVGERLRRGINEHLFQATEEKFQVSISIGVSSCQPQDMHNYETLANKLIDTSDKAMYQAKARGRNRVII